MTHPRKGRLLRVKLGYNPNSSSIGTIVFAMPAALLGLTVVFGAAAGLLSSGLLSADEDGDSPGDESDEPDTSERTDDSDDSIETGRPR